MNVADLLELQRTLQRNRIIDSASDKENVLCIAALRRKPLDSFLILQRVLDLVRKRTDFFNQCSFLLRINRTLCSRKCYGKNIACNKLCAVGLGCGNCDLASVYRT